MKQSIDIESGRIELNKVAINIIYLLIIVFSMGGIWYKFSQVSDQVERHQATITQNSKYIIELQTYSRHTVEDMKSMQGDIKEILQYSIGINTHKNAIDDAMKQPKQQGVR